MTRAVRLLALALAAAFVPGCGGGGGGGGGTPGLSSVLDPYPGERSERFLEANPAKHDPPDFVSRRNDYEADSEYDVRWNAICDGRPCHVVDRHLGLVKAAAAYARGATGTGETIVVADAGMDARHREFSGAGKIRIGASPSPGYVPLDEDVDHGTAVAGIAAANRDSLSGLNMHGVAFEANVYAVSIDLSYAGAVHYTPLDLSTWSSSDDEALAGRIRNVLGRNAGAIANFSWNYDGGVERYDPAALRRAFPRTAAALAQGNTRDADKTIVVWAAGNAFEERLADGTRPFAASPEVPAGLGVVFSELRRHVLAVAAVDQNGDIADYSNRCGRAVAFCLAAPGTDIVHPSGGRGTDDYGIGSGTSFAAPVVSGALALLRQYFRNADGTRALGNVELVRRLLATADRTGRYADSAVYGHGLLDLDAATRPVGALRTSLSSDPASRPLAGTGLDLAGGAFGSRLPEALAGAAAVGFDRLDASFPVSLSGLGRGPAREEGPTETVARGAETPSGLAVRALYDHAPRDGSRPGELLLSFSSAGSRTPGGEREWWLSWGRHAGRSLGLYRDGAAGLFADRSAFAAPWLALVRDGPGAGASLPLADGGRVSLALMRGSPHAEGFRGVGGDEGAGAVAEYRPDDGALSLQAGFVREEDGFLGARPRGALGEASAATAFAGFNRRQPLADGWDLLSSGWVGWTRPETGDGAWLAGVSELRSSAFGLGLERRSVWREGDRFGLRLSQPLSVESGSATLRYAVGRTAYREALVETRRVTLAPVARPWQVEAAWRAPWAGGELSASLGAERSAWTNAGRDVDLSGSLRFNLAF